MLFSSRHECDKNDVNFNHGRSVGIRGHVLKLLQSYLEGRKQFVSYNLNESSLAEITIAVPQGSILGPLLFLAYINDMHTCLQSQDTTVTLYADDGTITSSTNAPLKTELENECTHLGIWLKQNKLSITTLKTKCIGFDKNHPKDESIKIDGEVLESVAEVKYLGIRLDCNLNFKSHMDAIILKLSRLCGFLKFSRRTLCTAHKLKFYNYYIKPVIQYGLLVYGSTHKYNLEKISVLQKRILRVIYNKDRFYSSTELFERSDIMTVFELYASELLKYSIDNYTELNNIEQYDGERPITRLMKKNLISQKLPPGRIKKSLKMFSTTEVY